MLVLLTSAKPRAALNTEYLLYMQHYMVKVFRTCEYRLWRSVSMHTTALWQFAYHL